MSWPAQCHALGGYIMSASLQPVVMSWRWSVCVCVCVCVGRCVRGPHDAEWALYTHTHTHTVHLCLVPTQQHPLVQHGNCSWLSRPRRRLKTTHTQSSKLTHVTIAHTHRHTHRDSPIHTQTYQRTRTHPHMHPSLHSQARTQPHVPPLYNTSTRTPNLVRRGGGGGGWSGGWVVPLHCRALSPSPLLLLTRRSPLAGSFSCCHPSGLRPAIST